MNRRRALLRLLIASLLLVSCGPATVIPPTSPGQSSPPEAPTPALIFPTLEPTNAAEDVATPVPTRGDIVYHVITPTPLPKATPTERPEVSGDAIKRAVGAMSDEQKVGQLFLIGFAGPLTQVQIASFQQHHFGGLLLVQLNNNASGPAQTASFVNALQAAMASEPPLLVATDQEGGTVCLRWASITCFPGARRLALLPPQDAALAENDVDEELLAEGFNLHLAPVADVWDGEHPFMADRAFGQDPATVSAHIAAIIQAGHASGMMMTAKHFPGHGGASADSHVALPIVYHTRSVLEATDLPPFRTAIAAGVDVVMMAHLIVPAIDPDRPTSLSPNAHALLRGELGYTGVIMSDDIGMGAITSKGKTTADATVEALIGAPTSSY